MGDYGIEILGRKFVLCAFHEEVLVNKRFFLVFRAIVTDLIFVKLKVSMADIDNNRNFVFAFSI